MRNIKESTGCTACPLSRRRFLAAGCAGALGALAPKGLFPATGRADKMRVRIIYALHGIIQPGPDWPNVGFNFAPVMDGITTALAKNFPELNEAARKEVADFLNALDDHDDVHRVYAAMR